MVSFTEMGMEPAPAQRPFPLLVGGHSAAAMRRALRLGHGVAGPCRRHPKRCPGIVSRLRAEAGGELPPDFPVATRLHLPHFDVGAPGERFLEAIRVTVKPGAGDLTVDVFDHDAERYFERLRTVAGWLELKDGKTEMLA